MRDIFGARPAAPSDQQSQRPISPMRDIWGARPAAAPPTSARPTSITHRKTSANAPSTIGPAPSSVPSRASSRTRILKISRRKTPTTIPTTRIKACRTSPITFPCLLANQSRGTANSEPPLSTIPPAHVAALDSPGLHSPPRLSDGDTPSPQGFLHRPPDQPQFRLQPPPLRPQPRPPHPGRSPCPPKTHPPTLFAAHS